jgi:hypothetical protein
MDPFQAVLWITSIVFALVILRFAFAITGPLLRGCIRSTRKTLRTIRS